MTFCLTDLHLFGEIATGRIQDYRGFVLGEAFSAAETMDAWFSKHMNHVAHSAWN